MYTKPLVFLFFWIISLQAIGQTKQANLNRYFTVLTNNKQFNGSILVAEKGKVVFEESAGMADFSTNTPNSVDRAFPIASLSKTLTATAILQLAQSGKLNVQDAVSKYLPQFPYPNITVRHLLSHTSGMPPYNAYFDTVKKEHPDTTFTNADFIREIARNPRPLLYPPGEEGNYDNVNFLVLALVIEQVSGKSYDDYIDRNILRPAGMTHTRPIPFKLQYTQSITSPFAYPYLYLHKYSDSIIKAKEVPYVANYWSVYNFSGFGDYVSTLSDLLKYDQAYYNGRLVKKKSTDNAFQPVTLNNGSPNPANFGLGWQIDKDTSLGKVIYHSGNATGLSCILVRNISKHQTVIVYDNIHSNNSRELAFAVLKILSGVTVPLPKKSIAAAYARILLKEGPKVARERLMVLKEDTAHYQLSENEMNDIGYDFMGGPDNPNPYRFPEERRYIEALAILQLNAALFPNSWNTYDSYGEILLLVGRKSEAIAAYKKSIELNPNNEGGKKVLENLLK